MKITCFIETIPPLSCDVCVALDVHPFSVVTPLVVTLPVKAIAVETIDVVSILIVAISVESWKKVDETISRFSLDWGPGSGL